MIMRPPVAARFVTNNQGGQVIMAMVVIAPPAVVVGLSLVVGRDGDQEAAGLSSVRLRVLG